MNLQRNVSNNGWEKCSDTTRRRSMYKSIDLLLYSIIFSYFPSHKIRVNRFPSHYSSMLCMHRLSFIYGFVGRKNHKNTKYMHIFNLLFLYSKNMGIYIIPVNYDLYIIWSQPAIYTEVQLYTTRKVVNCMNDIQIMFYNLITFSSFLDCLLVYYHYD